MKKTTGNHFQYRFASLSKRLESEESVHVLKDGQVLVHVEPKLGKIQPGRNDRHADSHRKTFTRHPRLHSEPESGVH